jgi:hypothetical protein
MAIALISMEPEQRATLFVVPSDKSVIYFYRDDANDDTLPLALSIDGNAAGETTPAKFLFLEVEPGRHTLASLGGTSDSIELNTKAGVYYFVGQEVGCDAMQLRLRLHDVDAAAGKARVRALYAAGKVVAQDDTRAREGLLAVTCPL